MATRAEIRDEIADNLKRLRELRDQHLKDVLAQQTGDLIEKLPVRDRDPLKAQVRKALGSTKPKGGTTTLNTANLSAHPGVSDLVKRGTELVTTGVGAYIKAADLASDLAAVLLEIRRSIPNKHGLPDFLGYSTDAKAAAHTIYDAAGRQIAKDTSDAEKVAAAVEKLARAVRRQMSAQTVEYIRGLNRRKAVFRKEFPEAAELLERTPHLTPAEAVYALYEAKGITLPKAGASEKATLRNRAAAGELTSVTDQVRAVGMSMNSVTPDVVRELPDVQKRAIRRELDDTLERIKALIAATL